MNIEYAPSAMVSVVDADSLPVAADALTPKQEAFAQLVAAGSTATDAYRRAFDCKPDIAAKTVHSRGYDLMRRPDVGARIQSLRAAIADQFVSEVANLRLRQFDIATAEPITHVRVFNCRHCNGASHRYQWTDTMELVDALVAWQDNLATKPTPKPDERGGFGFDAFAPPNPECPECMGAGRAVVYLADTTQLTPAQRAAYRGASMDRYGVITIDQSDPQDAARELHRMIPGAIAPQRSESKSLTVHVEPLRDMTPEQIVALMAEQRLIPHG